MRVVTTKPKNVAIILSLLLLTLQILIRVDTFYLSDPLVKMIQVISLWNQNWSTEGILYSAKDFDPLFLMSPLNEGFVFLHEGRLIGQYPIGLTFPYSLLGFLPLNFLPYFNVVFFALFLRILFKNGIKTSVVLLVAFGTVTFPLLVDFSENGLFLVLSGYGYVFLYKAFLDDKKENWILGNIFLGLSLWLRLEGILLFISIQSTIFLIYYFVKKQSFIEAIHPKRYSIFFLFIVLFLIWNTVSYSHPLGTRYLTNFGKFEKQFYEQIKIFLSIAFTYPRQSAWSLGFFLHTPIFIYLFIKLRKTQILKNLNITFHLSIVILFLFFVAFTSPNDGITLTGRYLLVLVYPLSFLLNEKMDELQTNKVLFKLLYTWSFVCTTLIMVVFYLSSKELKKLRSELAQFHSPLIVTTNEILSGSFGLDLLNQKVISIRRKEVVKYFYDNINKMAPKEFMVLTVGKETKYNTEEKDVFSAILFDSKEAGYNCEKEERSSRVLARRCIQIDNR
ncbi:dolichyl-phosphate-mannose-protein mannosyltransferase [Leptospira kanakyensis]|uniref:Dolichyl-phosphate-mannose-protein mannosyltransferase n=1 Tax=Leptospira kanakyensis TaxID=2484968 RepID=A0A6N4QNH8_9LEPT|nr:dolichyl-phosphate-mannose-protein mannosyltransferase [Leptospira kanakyensis]TGK60912.1 dolichyl-phosphate-mannose-protein mannosyltransferase [Leptospira kanakyensis]TGK76613.1 dolichyl-phosphate-mannose-protein mannosyltransferase [Leptospira kanakyensis]